MSTFSEFVCRRLSAALLMLYPRQLRDSLGGEIHDTFAQRMRAAGGSRETAVLLARELGDSLRSGLRARWQTDPARGSRLPRNPHPHDDASPIERLRHSMDILLQDVRFALRTLYKNPGFAVIGILVLALGIGSTTAIFSVVNGVLLEPLPFSEPDRLVTIWETNPERGWVRAQVAAANYLDWTEQSRAVPEMAANADWLIDLVLTGDGPPTKLAASTVTGNFFRVLGVEAGLGSTFNDEDTWSGGEPKVLLSYALWLERFGADPEIVGSLLELDAVSRRVVGVAPRNFAFPFAAADIWVPAAWAPERRAEISFRRAHGYRVVGRLAAEVSLDDAVAELHAIATRLERQYPNTNTLMGVGAGSLHEQVVGVTRTPLLVLFAAVGMVLLIACANVANMQLARSWSRRREMSVRHALGAGRGRLFRQGLTESSVLALAGGAAGLLLAFWGTRAIVALSPTETPRLANVQLDAGVVMFALATTVIATILAGLAPAWRSARAGLQPSPNANARTTNRRRTGRVAATLVVCEVALALPLAIGAGLMVRTLGELREVELGFDPSQTVAMSVSLPAARYPDRASVTAFYRSVVERVSGSAGIRAAGLSTSLPFVNPRWSSDFRAESWEPDEFGIEVRHSEISPGLLHVLSAPMVAGADLDLADADSRLVALVNQALVDRYFPDRDPIGERLCFERLEEDCNNWFEVVGVTASVRHKSLSGDVVPRIFALVHQDWSRNVFIVVRGDQPPESLVTATRQAVLGIDPAMPLNSVYRLGEVVADAAARERLVLDLLIAFSVAGVLLAALGIHAVVAYTTGNRVREIGIRMALGASAGQVQRSVLIRGLAPVGGGIAVGLLLAFAASRTLASLLFGVTPTDPFTYATISLLVIAVATVSCYLPSRRATHVNPVEALRG